MDAKLNSDQFAQQIKSKYPEYASVDNVTLTQRMLSKYPQYADRVDVSAPAQKQPDLLSKAAGAVSSIFPGGQLGNAIGNNVVGLFDAGKQALGGDFSGAYNTLKTAGDQNNANFGKVVGDVTQAVLTPASAAISGPAGSGVLPALGRIGTNAALGASISGAGAVAQGKSPSDVGTSALAGGAIGGGTSAIGEGLSAVLNQLPNRLVKQALPKLDGNNAEYALHNTKVGSIDSLYQDSNASVSNLGSQIHTILSHPEYANDTGAGDFAVSKTLNAFPNSDYTPQKVVATIKNLVPAQSKIVDGVADGTATLIQKNALRSALDNIVKKAFTDAPALTANKEIGLQFANALRGEVQSFAPETVPVFANLTKELNLNSALKAKSKQLATKSALGLYDIVAALGGFATAGPVGSGAAIATEKALRSPAVGLTAAKGISAASKAMPVVKDLTKGIGGVAVGAATR